MNCFKQLWPATVAGASATQPGSSIQLNSIPDSCLIGVRKQAGNKGFKDADSYLTIDSLSIQFNNNPGILSNASQEQLYQFSREAGVNMSWNEFKGVRDICPAYADTVTMPAIPAVAGGAAPAIPAAALAFNLPAPSATAGRGQIATCGSLVKLDFGRHININQDYFAPGSIGTFQFQISNISVTNNTGVDTDGGPANQYELFVIFVYSGMIVSSLGSTGVYTNGLLTKENVLTASEKPVLNKGTVERTYGAGWYSNMKGVITKAQKYAKAPDARGAGYSAGGFSAGNKFKGRTF